MVRRHPHPPGPQAASRWGVCAVAGVALAIPAMAPRGQGHGDPTGSLVLPLRFLNWMG